MVNFLGKKAYIVLILIIIAGGIFLRSYHFSDWLHFELDQSRDAKIIDLAYEEGIGNLPLLGPKAAGSFLRLGPAFYYFNYLSALASGNTPSGIAFIMMIFGILAIPVFYLFSRRYFERRVAIGLLAVFAVSIFLVMYSRFSWNPNALPLFAILVLYSLLRTCDADEKRKGLWILASSFSLAIATQLHFLAFVAMPVIAVIYLAIKRPRIKILYWIGAVLVFLVLYSPMIINEIKTGGDNASELLKVTSKKSSDSDHSLAEKIFKNYTENSLGHFLILSGQSSGELPKLKGDNILKPDIICDQQCRDNLPLGILAGIFFTAGIVLLFKNFFWEKRGRRKDFIILAVIYFLVCFGLFTLLAFDMPPRFFLLISALPFIFLGLILEFFDKKQSKTSLVFIILVVLALVASNLWLVRNRFEEMNSAASKSFKTDIDKILKERTRVTLLQQNLITDYIEGMYEKNKYPVYVNSDSFYRRAFLYNLEQRNIPRDDFRNSVNSRKIYQNGNYFLIYRTLSNTDAKISKYFNNYELIGNKEFGTLTVFQLIPKKEAVNAVEQIFEPEGKPKSALGVPVRCRWNEVFGECNTDGQDDDVDTDDAES